MNVLRTGLWMALGVVAVSGLGCHDDRYDRRERVYIEERPRYVQPAPVIIEERRPAAELRIDLNGRGRAHD